MLRGSRVGALVAAPAAASHTLHSTSFGAAGVAAAATASPLITARRHKSFADMIHGMTVMRINNSGKVKQYTSKDVGRGPQGGEGYDPVWADFLAKKLMGPLKRKQGTQQDDYLNVDEAGRWMEAKHAAKLLNIKEDDLPKLTKEVLEEKWRKAYRERSNAKQEEVLIATEVLLEYLDSSVHMKKSRQYYRKFIENARAEVEQELNQERSKRTQSMMWLFGVAVTGACGVVLFVAFSRQYVTRKDINTIGVKTSEYFVMTFLQPKNTEPKPDYNTRYFTTPTSMELDKKSGRYENQFMSEEEVRNVEASAAYTERETAEMLKLFNDERERSVRETQNDLARNSRVSVYLPEELEKGEERAPSRAEAATAFEKMNFRDFSNMLASNFGGGSRFQRLTEETSARTEKLQAARERLKATAEPGKAEKAE